MTVFTLKYDNYYINTQHQLLCDSLMLVCNNIIQFDDEFIANKYKNDIINQSYLLATSLVGKPYDMKYASFYLKNIIAMKLLDFDENDNLQLTLDVDRIIEEEIANSFSLVPMWEVYKDESKKFD